MLTFPARSHASHAAGGELTYVWISDSTYRFFFKFYRDCTGISTIDHYELCATNPCSPQHNLYNITLPLWTGPITGGKTNGSWVTTGCEGYPTKCSDTASIIDGYEEWWYSEVITLGAKCDHWTFQVSVNARNPADNLAYNGGNLYLETTLNNSLFEGNSSPYFFVPPVPYFLINTAYQYSNGAMDPNMDSLVTQIIMPRDGKAPVPAGTPIGLQPGLNLTDNPFPTGNSFTLNSQTQQMSFTPTHVGTYTMTTRVSEYRNGKLVGYVDRDVQSSVIPITPSAVTNTLDKNTFANVTETNGVIHRTSAMQSISFCFDIEAVAPGTVLLPVDNHSIACPGSTLSYTQTGSDSVRGCFAWTPSINDSGIRMLTVIVKDSTCAAPGVATYWSYSYPINLDTLPTTSVNHIPEKTSGTVIYPNPAKQTLTVKTPIKYATAIISNSVGQVMQQQEFTGTNTHDVSTLPQGLYYLQLRGHNAETETLKFRKE